MIPPFDLVVARTVPGRYKVYLRGHGYQHLPRWKGQLYRYVAYDCQPFHGYESAEEATAVAERLFRNSSDRKALLRRAVEFVGWYIPGERIVWASKYEP
jgi:hypothetical protein